MKKTMVLALTLMLVLSAVMFVSADVVQGTVVNDADRIQFMKDRMEDRIENIAQLVKDGKLTADQAAIWTAHFTEMIKFHEANGFLDCGLGNGGMGQGMGRGLGRGHMGGFGMMNGLGTPPPAVAK